MKANRKIAYECISPALTVNAAKAPPSINQAPREAGAERQMRGRLRATSIIANLVVFERFGVYRRTYRRYREGCAKPSERHFVPA
jgi:hypothetical protein